MPDYVILILNSLFFLMWGFNSHVYVLQSLTHISHVSYCFSMGFDESSVVSFFFNLTTLEIQYCWTFFKDHTCVGFMGLPCTMYTCIIRLNIGTKEAK